MSSYIKFKLLLLLLLFSGYGQAQKPILVDYQSILTGAQQTEAYFDLINNKKVGIVANQASLIGSTHLVDSLIRRGVNVVKIFSPEHGFRGNAAEGELISNSFDKKTGIPIISLYGKHKKPTDEDMKGVEIVVFDLQDVGVRFYTYISTMTYMMDACARLKIPLIVLDRPNPNGFYVDGPVLEPAYASFVGLHPVPIVYGMSIGEYARMVNGEKWTESQSACDLNVIAMQAYTHSMIVQLPVKPSPNLPNWQSVYLYPSLCLFEGTVMSVGRGTDFPFQVFGAPAYLVGSFSFMPKSIPQISPNPKYKDQLCYGQNLLDYAENYQNNPEQLQLSWLINSYQILNLNDSFFTSYFEKLVGNDMLRKQLEQGMTEEEIRKTWKAGIENFKSTRSKYLLYE